MNQMGFSQEDLPAQHEAQGKQNLPTLFSKQNPGWSLVRTAGEDATHDIDMTSTWLSTTNPKQASNSEWIQIPQSIRYPSFKK